MKKFVSIILALSIFVALTSAASAVGNSNNSVMSVIAIVGTPTNNTPTFTPYAASAPTSFAPSTWYGFSNNHPWGAVNSTFAAYKFNNYDGLYIDFFAPGSFQVDFYYANGTFMAGYDAEYSSPTGEYIMQCIMDGPSTNYYFKIYNTSGSEISMSDASYRVYRSWD